MVRSRAPRRQEARRQQALAVAQALAQHYPVAECALHHESPFQLLAATILSAQCTDERVNLVTPGLFRRFPTPQALATASQEEVERLVQSTGFFRAKAKNLRGMAQALVEHHGGELPRTIEELTRLPGVGRKTANVLLGTAFGEATGVVVDTHVRRITRLLGLTRQQDPVKIERDLVDLLPPEEWINFSHRLIHHGRRVCIARRPRCADCPLLTLCDRVGLKPLPTAGPSPTDPSSAEESQSKSPGRPVARRSVKAPQRKKPKRKTPKRPGA
ncbi:MAG: endonuclease III [Planctomycetaceae bacterium]|jgi:endonuclease-3